MTLPTNMKPRRLFGLGSYVCVIAALVSSSRSSTAQVSIRSILDFSHQLDLSCYSSPYSGPALNPSGDQLWLACSEYYAAISLNGDFIFKHALNQIIPNDPILGSLTFDTNGNTWGVSGDTDTSSTTVFSISPQGKPSTKAKLNGVIADSGVAIQGNILYGLGFVLGSGYFRLFSYDEATGRSAFLLAPAASVGGFERGKPIIVAGSLYFPANDCIKVSSQETDCYELGRYNLSTGAVQFLAPQAAYAGSALPYGGGYTPAVDSQGNAYIITVDPGVPGADRLVRVTPSGTTTVLTSYTTLRNSYDKWAGLVYDPVHGIVYGVHSKNPDNSGSDLGTVLCYNTNTNHLSTIFSFNGKDGSTPIGDLAISADGTKLYGATAEGGPRGIGLLFELTLGETPPC